MSAGTSCVSEGQVLARFIAEALAPDQRERATLLAAKSLPSTDEASPPPIARLVGAAETESPDRPLPVLLLKMGGIRAAVPLHEVAALLGFTAEVPVHCEHDGRRCTVVDGARLFGQAFPATAGGVLLVAREGELALACERIEGRRMLAPEEWQPRRYSPAQPWLRGVVAAERRCVLHLPALAVQARTGTGTESAST